MIGIIRILDLQRKQQAGAGQPLGFIAPDTARRDRGRFAIEFEQHVALRTRNRAPWTENVPSAGAAVSDSDGAAVEADACNHPAPRRAIGADQRLLELRSVAGKPARQRNMRSDHLGNACHQFAAVDVQPIGKNEDACKIRRQQSLGNNATAHA